jgi:uncharacterized membrane protein YhiD involved in acid resistance
MAGSTGVSSGGGYYVIAVTATILALVVLYLLSLFERRLRASNLD